MVPSGVPSMSGQSGEGTPRTGLGFSSYENGPNPFSPFGVARPLSGFYQAQAYSAPSTHGGWIWNGFPSSTYPTFTFPNQTRVPNPSNETTPWGNSATSSTLPSQLTTTTGTPVGCSPPWTAQPTVAFPSQTQAPSSTKPLFGGNGSLWSDEKPISISATPAYSNKSHEELRLENYNEASRPIQPCTSGATSKGLGPTSSCGCSLFQKPEPIGAETFVDLLKSALSTNNFPIGIGFAGQFPPDTLVLCQLQSSTSVDPNGAVPRSKVPSSDTPAAFTCPEPGVNTASLKTQNAPETLAKISGQIEENYKSGFHSLFGELSPPSPAPAFNSRNPFTSPFNPFNQCVALSTPTAFTCPTPGRIMAHQKTQNAPETLVNTEKKSGQSTEGTFKSEFLCTSLFGDRRNSKSPFSPSPFSPSPFSPSPFSQYESRSIPEVRSSSLFEQKSLKSETGKSDDIDKAKDGSGSSAKLKLNISVSLDAFETDEVEAMMPKIQSLDYYTIPSVQELVEKELIEPGFCSRVRDFEVGRRNYGCIKFLGETDVRNLDLESLIKFDTRELTLFEGDGKKPEAGQSLNKHAEVTLLNVKCIDRGTGKECVDGPKVDKFRQMLMSKAAASGVEFVSYDAAAGEWKFRVQHF